MQLHKTKMLKTDERNGKLKIYVKIYRLVSKNWNIYEKK